MANALLTPSMVTKAAVPLFLNSNAFLGSIDRQYSGEFAKSGAKIGNTLNIRRPSSYIVSDGPALAVQDNTQIQTPLTISKQRHVDIAFTSVEQSLDLMEFSELVLKPAMNTLAAHVAADVMSVALNSPNLIGNGMSFNGSGVLFPPTGTTFNQARAQLAFNSAPAGDLTACMDFETDVRTAASLQGLFNPTGRISANYDSGEVKGPALGIAKWMADQTIPVSTFGSYTAMPTVNGAGQTGTTIALVAGIAANLNVGDIITFAGVNAVNRINYESTGKLRQFVVTATYANGAAINIYPSLVPVNMVAGLNTVSGATVTASPANGAQVYAALPSGTAYRRNLVYQKQAFTLATADLPTYGKGVVASAQENYQGISLRFLQSYDTANDRLITRMDILYGYAQLVPEWSCIVADIV